MHDVKGRNIDLSTSYIATLAAMDGSRARRRTFAAALATVAALSLAPAALAQSAGDDQYSDPLAGGGQEPRQSPSTPGGGDTPSPAPPPPAPAPAPAPAPSGPDTSTSDDAPSRSTATAPVGGETLPHTGAEPAPAVATGLLLLLGGALLRQRTLRGAAR